MKNSPLVSVIIPAYNHEMYIEEALQSVINQTYKNIEVIIINDGSTDSTAEILEKFIKNNQDKNIQFVDKQNEGVCKTLNMGLAMATGDYVAFLASDDLWLPDKISMQLEFMEKNKNVGMVFSDAWFLRFNTKTDIKWSDHKHGINKYFQNCIQNTNMYTLLLTHAIIPAVTVMIRKTVLEEVGFFDDSLLYEDKDMWLRIARVYPIAYIDRPLALYRLHNNNISNNSLFMIRGLIQTTSKHLKMEPFKNKPIMRFFIVSRLVFNILIHRIKKRRIQITLQRRLG